MHAVTGRPNLLYTPSANRVPYAPVGTARPPRQGGHGAAGGGGAKGPSHRAKARDRWSALFAGPAYLEPGPSNRLVLSLRSCVPSEVDFALERLIQVSSIDPDLLRFNEFPGLLDGLVSLVRDYLDRRKEDRQAGVHHLVAAGLHAEARDISRRRACEASLILRNLALEKKSFDPILESRRLRRLIVDVLDEGELDGPEGEETTELRLYLLELVELIGEHVALAIPGHSIPLGADASDDAPQPKPEPLDAPSVRLFPLLVNLAASQDRALVLSAFRCLTALSLNEKSDQVFALLTYTHLAPQPKPSPHPVETAIRLLPLGDAELTSVVLDFLYQHTLLPSNAALFCTRPELVAILKLVCQKFELGAKIEQVETEILSTPSDAANWYKAKFGVIVANENGARTKRRKLHSTAASPAGEPVLPEAEVNEIVALQEPERAIGWMHRMYEIDPDSDITQVSLWTAYKTQFEPITQNPAVPAMLAAQEVIRLSGQAFPSATPTIVDDAEGRKFIIKGLKHRKRETVEGECGWAGCPVPAGHDDPLQFHQHVYNTHLNVSPPPAACCWTNCRFEIPVPPPPADPSLQIGQITLHVRTHLPLLSGSTSSSDVAAGDDDDDVSLPKAIAYHVRYHGQKDDHHHEATGPGFLACLILRNVVRAAKFAHESTVPTTALANGGGASATQVGGGRVSVASGNAAIGRLAEGEQSIFEAFALAEESVGGVRGGPGGASSGRKGSVLQQVEKPDWSIAVPAIAALQSVHDRVLRMALSNVVLGKYLVESVVTIEGFGAATDTGNAVSTTQGDKIEE